MAKHVPGPSVSIYFSLSNYIALSGYKEVVFQEEERSSYERAKKFNTLCIRYIPFVKIKVTSYQNCV